MPSFQKFLAALMLFFPAVYALANYEQAQAGKVKGFTGAADVELTGDYLSATFCYCEYPPNVADVLGHYYQFEYYNVHLNSTFILTSSCPDPEFGYEIDCVPPSGGEHLLAGYTMDENCRAWKGYQTVHDQKKKDDDQFCYKPHHHDGNDYMSFNGQKRNLGWTGGQGPVLLNTVESEKVCEGLCRENLEIPVLTDPSYPRSHQVVWTNVADMCEHCE